MLKRAARYILLRALLPVLALATALAAQGCGSDEPVTRVDMDKRVQVTAPRPPEALTYAYLPQYSHTISYERHHRIVRYLARATGLPVRQVFPSTFDEHIKMVARGEIDISFSNPFIYVTLARQSGARAFARMVEPSGRPFFRGQVIARSDNEHLNALEDCRGARWIAVDPFSAGGFLFPLGLFMDHGIGREDFDEIAFAPGPGGNQENVVMSVYAGKYDIGSIREGTLALMKGRIELDSIRVLAETRDYPGWVYAARKGLDPAIRTKVARALFALDSARPEHTDILDAAHMHGIIPATDADYDPIRDLVATLGPALGHMGEPAAALSGGAQ